MLETVLSHFNLEILCQILSNEDFISVKSASCVTTLGQLLLSIFLFVAHRFPSVMPVIVDHRPKTCAPKLRVGGGDSHMKGVRMLVVLLRGVNLGFWSHLGCSGQNGIRFNREGFV